MEPAIQFTYQLIIIIGMVIVLLINNELNYRSGILKSDDFIKNELMIGMMGIFSIVAIILSSITRGIS